MALKVTAAANGNPVLYLYGVVGESFTAEEVQQALRDIPSRQNIDVRIHSEGGSYTDSIAINSTLRARQGKRSVYIDGLAASGGSVIAMAGTSIEMANASWMMIHEAHGAMSGRAGDFRAAADRLEAINNQLVDIYKARWKGTEAELRKAIADETWLNADNAIAAGLADKATESLAIAACVNASKFFYNKVPRELTAEAIAEKLSAREARLAEALA